MTLEEFTDMILGHVAAEIDEGTYEPWAKRESEYESQSKFDYHIVENTMYVRDNDKYFIITISEDFSGTLYKEFAL